MSREILVNLVLRIGVAFSFLFPPINALFDPYSWIGYFPRFVQGVLPDSVLLHGFGILEVIIALWILSGKRIFWPSLAAAAMLVVIVVFNPSQFQILFRDLSVAGMAAALAVLSYPKAAESARETKTRRVI